MCFLINQTALDTTVELFVVQLIVILFSLDCPHRFGIALFQFIVLLTKFDRIYITYLINIDSLNENVSNMDWTILWSIEQSNMGHTFQYSLPNFYVT